MAEPAQIPVVGAGTGPFAGQLASMRSIKSLKDWVGEGYRKYYSTVFKVRAFQDWQLIVSGPTLIDELRKAPDDVLSFREATAIGIQSDYTLGDWRDETPLHIGLVKTRLTRSLPGLFPSVVEEIDAAFSDEITNKLHGNEWTTMAVVDPLSRVVCRTSNRVFVGLPLCRNPEYVDINVRYTVDVIVSANIIKQFPQFLKPLVGRYMTPIPKTYAKASRVMTEFIDERKRQSEEHGKNWEDKPDDFLQWILDAGEARDKETPALITRLLRLNFAAIHTTALSFTFALYHVAAEPVKYQEALRQEVHEVLSRHGWTKPAMEKMRKMDSLLRETQRYHGLGALSMTRLAMQDFTFSDGTHVKKGQLVAAASRATHYDGSIYPEPDKFDGFRFYNENEEKEDELSLPNRLVSTSFDFLTFGTGRHACPGRFWAANEMKAMMAYMLTHYDMKMEHEGEVPKEQWFGSAVVPDRSARMMLRKREAQVY
ncbi:cytochrome P450 [Exidia glandulosa HHB12029]|uniref:Cytochrome P450 n=1 Tax=Exidia glandulosa HHB12029 TaxID=1314781 RepID=A0A165CX85_EXIGL|nr:cytochrome P450 [Exidia glandulosa HHB12029]